MNPIENFETISSPRVVIPKQVKRQMPAYIYNRLTELSVEEQRDFLAEFSRKRKSRGTAYLLWLCLGWHYGYLGKWGLQVLYLLTFGGFLIWLTIDLFRIHKMVFTFNHEVATKILVDMNAVS